MMDLFGNLDDLSPEQRELLALLLEEQGVDLQSQPVARRKEPGATAPLSFAQQRLWFLDQLEPGSPMYNMPAAARLRGALSVPTLQAALDEIAARHEVLRTVFERGDDGEPEQRVLPDLRVPVETIDLSALPAEERESELIRLATAETQRPFDLSRGPLVRVTLLALAQADALLLLNMHHIVTDGWSIGVFLRELGELYAAFDARRPSPLPSLPLQYGDYALWQRDTLQGAALEKQLAFWRGAFADAPAVLELPFDRPRPAVQTYNGAAAHFAVPRRLQTALNELAQRENATLFMTLMAAFQVLLYRYSRQTDICVGTPIANRTRGELEGLIGFFANTLVMRGRLAPRMAFREFLGHVRETTLAAYEHQDAPFEQVVEAAQPERTLSYAPLFQVMFVLQNTPQTARQLPGMSLSPVRFPSVTAKFDLTLNMSEGPQGIEGSIEYNTDLFDPATVERFIEHFLNLCEGIVAEPERAVGLLPLLSVAERRRLVEEWNATATGAALDDRIEGLFEAQVDRTPDEVALVFGEQRITYAELDRRANRLAHFLRGLGVGPESLVGVCMERAPDLIVALLAALKAGGAYVPMDPRYPRERLEFMAEDAAVAALITDAATAGAAPANARQVVNVDRDRELIAAQPAMRLRAAGSSGNLSYVLFTSGSTGRPKGVAIQHRSAIALIRWAERVFAPDALAAVLASTSISFDLSVYEIFLTLSVGGRLILVENALGLLDNPAVKGVTLINTVPSAASELLRLDGIPRSVGTVNLAGEPLSQQLVGQLYALPFVRDVYDLYGPTEDTTYSTYTRRELGGVATIGRPIDNTQAYLLDEFLNPVPQGVAGEVFLGGAGVARGYLNRAELTAERFVPDPFAPLPGARMYRTGDLARHLPDGRLQYLGRIDHQVKLRGFRIELGEIEKAIEAIDGIAKALVTVREDAPGDKQLVAYVERVERGAADLGLLRGELARRLPSHMAPTAYVAMETWPLTPNGKIDRRRLPAPQGSGQQDSSRYVAPRTPVEETIAGIFAAVLRAERVGAEDDFFHLGGHSLLATQLVSRVRQAFGVDLPLRDVFVTPTVAGLAASVERSLLSAHGGALPPITPAPREADEQGRTRLPLSFAQQRLWFLEQLDPGGAIYNIPAALRLTGRLDADAVDAAFAALVARHESLRTTFDDVNGKAVQVIHRSMTLAVDRIDLSGDPEEEREARAVEVARGEARRPFDLAAGPLMRGLLLRLDEQEHLLLLTMHHIISDGWSIAVLIREFARLYEAHASEEPGFSPALPPLPLQYADYAVWQRTWLEERGEDAETTPLQRQLGYWREQLAGLPALLELPADRPRPPELTYRGGLRKFHLPPDLNARLRQFGRDEGGTLYMTLLATLEALLQRVTGQEDFAIGSPVAGRSRVELEPVVGFFINTLVMRSDTRRAPAGRAPATFRELLARVRQSTLDAYAHQDVPFEMLVGSLDVARSASHTPLFQVMLTLQNIPGEPLRLPGLTLTPFDPPAGTAKFDLNWTFVDDPAGMQGALEYSADLFDAETADRFVACFVTLLTAALRQPDAALDALPIVPESDRALIFGAWNDTRVDIDSAGTIHARFAEQARRAPDALAVVAQQEVGGAVVVCSLTYGELNARADQLARRLRGLGVGPESIVGLTIERTTDLLVGVMGILKAGAAYLPLDPSYPADRLAYMLADSGARVLVTYERFVALAQGDITVVCLDRDEPEPAALPAEDRAPLAGPDNIAYVIYTSGSTGRPKGVAIQHRAALNLAGALDHAAYRHSPLDRPLRLSLNAPLAFDASVQQLVMLTQGHTLYLVPQDARGDGAAFLAFVRRHRLDQFDCVPSQLKLILDAGLLEPGAAAQGDGWTPSIVFPGGEAIDDTTWAKLAAAPATDFYNMYGPTECAVDSTTVSAREAPGRATIGRPVANARSYVLDHNLQPVPVGVPGELFIAGAGVGRGYLNRPDLTAERFLPDPFVAEEKPGFSSEPNGARMYRTGDLARWTRDGLLEFLGRVDFQVKVRGFRIELGEIEDRLRGHEGVREAVVIAREIPGSAGAKQLVAYTTAAADVAPPVAELRRHLLAALPDYMVPAIFVTLDEMPLTPNRKIDRNALPAPEAAGRADAGAEFVEPATPAEKTLAEVWSQVLGVPSIGAHDNFFELGGDSILSIQVVSRANQSGLNITPKQLFQAPTLSALATLAGVATISAAEQGPVEGPVRLTPIQRRFFELELSERNHWNQSVLLSVTERLDAGSLSAAVAALVEHHDALRLRFSEGETGWGARNAGPVEAGRAAFERIDVSALDDAAFSAEVERRAGEEQAALDIVVGPLFRALYFDAGDGRRGRLFLVIHHLAVDGVSWRILLEDLQTAYGQHLRAGAIRLPPKTVSFKAWSEKLAAYAESEAALRELDDWLGRVNGWIAPLPVDNVCDPAENTELNAGQVGATLSAEETAALLTEANAAYNTEVPDLLLCALAQAMEKWTGEPTLYADLEGHGREEVGGEEVDLSRTVGWFTTLYPVRIELPWSAAPGEAIIATKEQLRMIPQRGLGYGLLRYLGPDEAREALAAAPEPEMTFNYLGQFDQALSGGGPSALGPAPERPGRDRAAANRRDHLLDVTAAVAGGRLSVSWTYSRAAHDEATVRQLAEWHISALRDLIAHCRSPEAGAYTPSDFPLAELDQRQLDKVLKKVKTQGSEGTR